MSIPLICLKQLDSTQDFLDRHIELYSCGIMANDQLFGYGRRGNCWQCIAGSGLYLSVVLPHLILKSELLLQQIMIGISEILCGFGFHTGVKWPNDLVAWQGKKIVKIGGIIGKKRHNGVIVGVGINILKTPFIYKHTIDVACLADLYPNLINQLTIAQLASSILELWQDFGVDRRPGFYWPYSGDLICWNDGRGICEVWNSDGSLTVQTKDGLRQLYIQV